MSKWRKLNWDKDVQLIPPGNSTVWDDCTIGIKCSCGCEKTIVLDSQNEDSECEKCHRKFRMGIRVEVLE